MLIFLLIYFNYYKKSLDSWNDLMNSIKNDNNDNSDNIFNVSFDEDNSNGKLKL